MSSGRCRQPTESGYLRRGTAQAALSLHNQQSQRSCRSCRSCSPHKAVDNTRGWRISLVMLKMDHTEPIINKGSQTSPEQQQQPENIIISLPCINSRVISGLSENERRAALNLLRWGILIENISTDRVFRNIGSNILDQFTFLSA